MSKKSFLIKELTPCFLAIFIDILGFSLLLPILASLFLSETSPLFSASTPDSVRYTSLSLAYAIAPMAMFFGSSFMGDLSDFIGRKKVLMACMLGIGLSYFLMGASLYFRSITLLLAGRVFSGLMAASQPVALAIVSDLSTDDNKALHMSWVALLQSFGLVLGPLMGGVLFISSFPELPFLICLILSLTAFIWLFFGFKETFTSKAGRINPLRVFTLFYDAAKDRRIRFVSLAFFLMQFGIGLFLQVILILLIKEYNYTHTGIGLFNGYMGVGFILGLALIIPWATKRFRIEYITAISILFEAFFIFLMVIFKSVFAVWIFCLPFAMAGEVAYSGTFTTFSNAADRSSQGWAMGIQGAVIAVAFILSSFAPTLIPALGTTNVILISSLLMLISGLLFLLYCKKGLPPVKLPHETGEKRSS